MNNQLAIFLNVVNNKYNIQIYFNFKFFQQKLTKAESKCDTFKRNDKEMINLIVYSKLFLFELHILSN